MSKQVEAVEVVTTGYCPFNCSYCYIPKTEMMKEIHEQIREWIKSGTFIDALEAQYGDRLKFLGFWGTEPTLTLLEIPMEPVFERFPNLEALSFSTAMMTDPSIIVEFIKGLVGHKINVKVQVSLDGPAWLTDTNRMEGASQQIPENLIRVLQMLSDVDLKEVTAEFSWKPTHSIENIAGFLEQPARVKGYYEYFNDVNKRLEEANKNPNVTSPVHFTPTLVVPGKYTSKDGRMFAEYVKMIHKMGFETTYTGRLWRLFEHSDDLIKRRQFSCSAADSNEGITENVHMCHRTFYYDYPGYISAIINKESSIGDVENWDVTVFEQASLDFINRNFIIDPKDKWDLARFHYVMRGYHDFWRHQLAYCYSMTKELARAGQANKVFLEDEWFLNLFAVFLNVAMSCPMENLLNTGSIHLQPVSLIRMFGNGAFEEFFRFLKEKVKKK